MVASVKRNEMTENGQLFLLLVDTGLLVTLENRKSMIVLGRLT